MVTPDNLTITVSVGESLFDERFGLSAAKPKRLIRMVGFPNDALEAAQCHGDLSLQFCSNTPDTNIHALRDIVKNLPDLLLVRWKQEGSVPPQAPARPGEPAQSARNFLGFRDGSANPNSNDAKTMDQVVWVQPGSDEPAWAANGSYQAVRIIRNFVERRDRTPLQEQESIIGRIKPTGAPMGGQHEAQVPDYSKDPARQADQARCPYPPGQPAHPADPGQPDPAPAVQLLQRRQQKRSAGHGAAVHLLPGRPGERLYQRTNPAQRRAPGGVPQASRRRVFLHLAGGQRDRRTSSGARYLLQRTLKPPCRNQPQSGNRPMKKSTLALSLLITLSPLAAFAATRRRWTW